jgi:membrane-associated phospholipid phosphatase
MPAAHANRIIENLGDILMAGVPAYALGLSVMEPDWTGTIQLLESYAAAQISTSGLQKLVKEPRPNGGKNGFPSGHATAAFSGAMFIHKRYGLRQAAVPYAMAAFVGYSRVESRWHYWHDVVGGMAVSALWTWLLVGRKNDAPSVMVSADSTGARLDFFTRF